MDTITDTHDLIIVGGGAAVVESATIARLNGLHPLVVPMIPTRLDLLHRPLRVWDGDRELRGRAVVIAADDGPLPAVYRDWLAHEVGPLGVGILRAAKAELDPAGILNPGILIPPA